MPTTIPPCALFFLPNLGCLGAKKNSFSSWFSSCFSIDFLEKKKSGLIPLFIHLSIFFYLFGFGWKPFFFFYWASRRGKDQVWRGFQECFERWRHVVERIKGLKVGKSLYTLLVLYSGIFLSIVNRWFFIFLEVFNKNSGVIVSLSFILILDLFSILVFIYH